MPSGREFIKDAEGNDVKNAEGERLFYSTEDGDRHPDTEQKVYSEDKSAWGGSTKTDTTYNPSKGEFNKNNTWVVGTWRQLCFSCLVFVC
jgi:hypothetical protein